MSTNSLINPPAWADIPSLITAFENCTLAKERWTHEAHLVVAHHYLWHHSRVEAALRMRSGIQRYNLSHGNLTGYHETITLAWLAILARELRKRHSIGRGAKEETASARKLVNAYADQDILFEYYTRELLMSEVAGSVKSFV